jgi:hypothetical protein
MWSSDAINPLTVPGLRLPLLARLTQAWRKLWAIGNASYDRHCLGSPLSQSLEMLRIPDTSLLRTNCPVHVSCRKGKTERVNVDGR